MAKQILRGFTEPFCQHMTRSSAWPPYKTAIKHFKANAGGIKRERYGKLKDGQLLPEKYAVSLVKLLLKEATAQEANHTGRQVSAYYQHHGWPLEASTTVEEGVARLCITEHADLDKYVSMRDKFQEGISAVTKALVTAPMVDRFVQACASPAEVHESIEWIYVTLGRVLAEDSQLSPAMAIEKGSQQIKLSLEEYQRRAVQWWTFNPWTIVRTRGNKGPVGVSIWLPATEAAYQAVLEGRQPSYDCDPSQLTTPTTTLILEAVADRPFDYGAERSTATNYMPVVVLAQAGAFTHRPRMARPKTVKMMSFAAIPVSVHRLTKYGFQPTGVNMKSTDVPLFELTLATGKQDLNRMLIRGTMQILGEVLDSPPAP